MWIFRKVNRYRAIFWLLAMVIAMRSLVAPGFMLDFNGENPLGITITLCGGWANSDQPDPLDDPHAMHKGIDTNQHQHESDYELSGTSCEIWSTSSTFVQTVVINIKDLLQLGSDNYLFPKNIIYDRLSFLSPQQPRAPPSFRQI
jgi:hypothetical protein